MKVFLHATPFNLGRRQEQDQDDEAAVLPRAGATRGQLGPPRREHRRLLHRLLLPDGRRVPEAVPLAEPHPVRPAVQRARQGRVRPEGLPGQPLHDAARPAVPGAPVPVLPRRAGPADGNAEAG